jgi:hypothetical protein
VEVFKDHVLGAQGLVRKARQELGADAGGVKEARGLVLLGINWHSLDNDVLVAAEVMRQKVKAGSGKKVHVGMVR